MSTSEQTPEQTPGQTSEPPSEATAGELFEAVLGAPDRDRFPGRRPVVSFRDDDEADYLAMLEAHQRSTVRLSRRGIFHGSWAELEHDPTGPHPAPPEAALIVQRWHEARPIPWRFDDPRAEFGDEIGRKRALFDELKDAGGLRRFLKERRAELEPDFALHPRQGDLYDEQRDIELVRIQTGTSKPKEVWAKAGWLSNHDADDSLRLRLSFGREEVDDASRDLVRQLLVSELGTIVFPETELFTGDARLNAFLTEMCAGEVFPTQAIGYWNGPEGGALFHHDAFEEQVEGGQRGVCYIQLSGRTAWLALSIEDLARRVIEFGAYLAEGELPWVRDQLYRTPEAFDRFQRMLKRFPRVMRELARPGCGALGKVVNRGPEFTSLLADAGHAFLLEPGDALILPNHGPRCTAMHSVFGAADDASYGLSLALRERRPPAPLSLPESEANDSRRNGRRKSGHGRRRHR